MPESATNRVISVLTDSIECRNLIFLKQALESIFVDYEYLPELSLKEYLCHILDSALIKQPEYSEDFFNSFVSLYNFIQEGCPQNQIDWHKRVKINLDVIYEDIESLKPTLLPFILQIGGKWLNYGVHGILEKESFFESNFENLLKSFYDKNKVVSILYDHLIQASRSQIEYFDKLNSLKKSLKSLSYALPKNQKNVPCLKKEWSGKIKTINNFFNSFRLLKIV